MTTDAMSLPEHGPSGRPADPSDGAAVAPGGSAVAPGGSAVAPGGSAVAPGGAWAAYLGVPTEPARLTRPGWRAQTAAVLAVGGVVTALGWPLGWLWSSVAPWLPAVVRDGSLYYADPEGEQRAAQESWYALISVGAGVLLGVLAWVLLRRFRGPLIMAGLAVGSWVSGWIMWRFGRSIGRAHAKELARAATDGMIVKLPVDIRIQRNGLWHGVVPYIAGDLVYMAIAAVAIYAILAGFSYYSDLMPRHKAPGGAAPGDHGPTL